MYLSFYRLTHYNFRKYKQLSPPHANFSSFSQKKHKKQVLKPKLQNPLIKKLSKKLNMKLNKKMEYKALGEDKTAAT